MSMSTSIGIGCVMNRARACKTPHIPRGTLSGGSMIFSILQLGMNQKGGCAAIYSKQAL